MSISLSNEAINPNLYVNQEILRKTEIGTKVLALCEEAVTNKFFETSNLDEFLKARSEKLKEGLCTGYARNMLYKYHVWNKNPEQSAANITEDKATAIALQTLHHLEVLLTRLECRFDLENKLKQSDEALKKECLERTKKIEILKEKITKIEPSSEKYEKYRKKTESLERSNERVTKNQEEFQKPHLMAWSTSEEFQQIKKISGNDYKLLQDTISKIGKFSEELLNNSGLRLVKTENMFYGYKGSSELQIELTEIMNHKDAVGYLSYDNHSRLIHGASSKIFDSHEVLSADKFTLLLALLMQSINYGNNLNATLLVYRPQKISKYS